MSHSPGFPSFSRRKRLPARPRRQAALCLEQLESRDQPAPLALGAGAPIFGPIPTPAATTLVAAPTNQNIQQNSAAIVTPAGVSQNSQQNPGTNVTSSPAVQPSPTSAATGLSTVPAPAATALVTPPTSQIGQQNPAVSVTPPAVGQTIQQNPGTSATPPAIGQTIQQNPGPSVTPPPALQPFLTSAATAILTNMTTTGLGTFPAQTGLLASQTTVQNPPPGVASIFPNQGSIGPAFNNQNGQQSPILGLVPFQSSQGPTRGLPAPFAMLGSGGPEKPQNRTAERPSAGQEQSEAVIPEEPVEPGPDMTLLLLDSQFQAEVER